MYLKHFAIVGVMTAFFLSLPLSAGADELDVDQLMSALEDQLQLSRERYEALKPKLRNELEQKSRELSRSLDSALDRGLTELERLEQEYDKASQASSEKLREFLESDEVTELKAYLAGLDRQAIEQARDELVAEFVRVLELSAEQIEAMKPLLRDKLEQLGAIIKRYLDKGKSDFEQFRVEFEAESRRDSQQLREILDDRQIEQFEMQLESIKQAVRAEVFEV